MVKAIIAMSYDYAVAQDIKRQHLLGFMEDNASASFLRQMGWTWGVGDHNPEKRLVHAED